ncbi:jacalin-like lectin domain-containing protein [Tanacetum coccineum]|uniref:Jacalin-like lectin domain-containing protein n=1 Tax=Tanacetum coccineum TaxID=301880 RepID=A0ABQ5CED7_9ASTR
MADFQEPAIDSLRIPLDDIKLATNNFANDNFIGQGGFGRVYKGQLKTSSGEAGTLVAVKRLDKKITGQGRREFLMEIMMLASYKHNNLVSLVGFSDEEEENALVYKHEVHGSLDMHLATTNLKWETRLEICLGAARGLEYLHDDASGLSWIVLCGRLAMLTQYDDNDVRKLLYRLTKHLYDEGKLDEIIFPDLLRQSKTCSLEKFAKVAYECLNKDRKQRPTMSYVVQELEATLKLQIGQIVQTELWGSIKGGHPWSFMLKNNQKLRKIIIDHNEWIYSVTFIAEDINGSLVSQQYGASKHKLSEGFLHGYNAAILTLMELIEEPRSVIAELSMKREERNNELLREARRRSFVGGVAGSTRGKGGLSGGVEIEVGLEAIGMMGFGTLWLLLRDMSGRDNDLLVGRSKGNGTSDFVERVFIIDRHVWMEGYLKGEAAMFRGFYPYDGSMCALKQGSPTDDSISSLGGPGVVHVMGSLKAISKGRGQGIMDEVEGLCVYAKGYGPRESRAPSIHVPIDFVCASFGCRFVKTSMDGPAGLVFGPAGVALGPAELAQKTPN